MNSHDEPNTRLEELFIAELVFGLTDEEAVEFEALRSEADETELQSLAEVIATLDHARASADDVRLPEHLRERIRVAAAREMTRTQPTLIPAPRTSQTPWMIAAASVVAMVIVVAINWRSPAVLNPAELRSRLIATVGDVIRVDWSPGPTPVEGAQGDIVWSTAEQRGYMRFAGMRPNDPTVEQYQLWIFDRNQDEKTPVDGGVFDIASNGEVIVPVRPTLNIREPYLFAVTIEKPGGVVVSDRSRLPLLAAINP